MKACEEDAERVFSLSDDEEEAVEHYELLMARHWATEKRRIEAELKRWTTFQEYRTRYYNPFPEIPLLEEYDSDGELANASKNLDGWRKFEAYQHISMAHAAVNFWPTSRKYVRL